MFAIKHLKDQDKTVHCITLSNEDRSCHAQIYPSLGGSLQELKLRDRLLISTSGWPYHRTFASSVLFPFANRIERGKYRFGNKDFELEINEPNHGNALHGQVFYKPFQLISHEVAPTQASAVLTYEETAPSNGFPFKYGIVLQYVLTMNALELHVEIQNNDEQAFPFSLGWHPYFKADDLYNCYLDMDSSEKILVNDRMIPCGRAPIEWHWPLKIENRTFDECYVLNSNRAVLITPEYQLELRSSYGENYLQIFTPDSRTCIAIEPQTAPANSFNNKVGLKILEPGTNYKLSWTLILKH